MSRLLAEAAERGGYKIEWYPGKIVVQASASAFHNLIVSRIVQQLPAKQWWGLPNMPVGTPGDRRSLQPDIVIVPAGSLGQDENPLRKELVSAVIEVTSDATRSEDYGDKPEMYARMHIPVYAIVDQPHGTVRMLSQPELGRYTVETASSVGSSFTFPDPISVTIDTAMFPNFAGD